MRMSLGQCSECGTSHKVADLVAYNAQYWSGQQAWERATIGLAVWLLITIVIGHPFMTLGDRVAHGWLTLPLMALPAHAALLFIGWTALRTTHRFAKIAGAAMVGICGCLLVAQAVVVAISIS
jgi:hypothetical protein